MLVSKRQFCPADRLDSSGDCWKGPSVVHRWALGNLLGPREGESEGRLTSDSRRIADRDGLVFLGDPGLAGQVGCRIRSEGFV